MPPGVVDVRRPVGVDIEFDVLRQGKPLFPKIKVLDQEGAIAFNAMDTDERWLRPSEPGAYVATAWIPGNLLNEGSAIVEAAVCSLDFPKLEHHAAVYEAVSFEVLDPGTATRPVDSSAVSGGASSGLCSSGHASPNERLVSSPRRPSELVASRAPAGQPMTEERESALEQLARRLWRAELRLAETTRANVDSERRLQEVYASTSWRVTAPLRAFSTRSGP